MSAAHYLLQANIYLIVFYLAYKFLLEKETYFILNRIYLLSAGVLSLAIPFLRFEWFTKQPVTETLYMGIDQMNMLITEVHAPEASTVYTWGNVLVVIYLAGLAFFTFRFIWKIICLRKLLKNETPGSAFSFFGQKRIDINLPNLQTIHRHEEIHIRQLHSIDVLFFELLNVFFWFNPVVYGYKRSLRNIHEYLADEAAAIFQGDKKAYALLLLSKAFDVSPNVLTNSFFNKSLIKKRIAMLHKERSTKKAIIKYGMFVPLFVLALIMSSATIRENEKMQQMVDQIPLDQSVRIVRDVINHTIPESKSPAVSNQKLVHPKHTDRISNRETQMPPSTDWKALYTHLAKFVRYPSAAQQGGIQGTSMIKFTIANGTLDHIGVVAKLGGGCDAEAMRVIASYPGFSDANNGSYTLKFIFQLENSKAPKKNENLPAVNGYVALSDLVVVAYEGAKNKLPEGVHDFISIDKQPRFPGGMIKFYEYLSGNLKYPSEAKTNQVQGKVYLSFIVETDGALSNITVDRRLGSGTDEEATRVLSESPKWIPGEKDGKPVRVKYHIPIAFSLSKKGGSTDSLLKSGNLILKSPIGSAPLTLVDGKEVSGEEMKKINPNDIHAIKVLKDQELVKSYGEKGKYGVIVITTKEAHQKTEAKNK